VKGRSIQRGLDMQKGPGVASWLRQLAVVAGYAVLVSLVRDLSFSHWVLLAGLHVAVLLLAPYRYWAALVVGDIVSLGYISITCLDQLGLTWSICNVLLSSAWITPVVYVCREHWRVFPTRSTINMGVLLFGALLVALVKTGGSLLLVSTAKLPPGYPPLNYGFLAAQWVLGSYMGILTVLPFVLVVREVLQESSWRELGVRFIKSRLALECVFVLMPSLFDHGTLNAQVFIAFIISTMLIAGARIGALNQQAQQERTDMRLALALAQRNVRMGEVQLHMTSQALEQVRESVHSVYNMMLGRLRNVAPVIDDRSYRRQALVAQDQLYRLADSLCPVTRERGLPAVLREGPIARVLEESGMSYWCDLRGPVSLLSATIQLAIYRLVCEAVADGCTRRDISDIRVQVRCGHQNDRRWTVVRVNLCAHADRLSTVRWDDLLPRVLRTATGLGWPAIEDRAATFEGRAREHMITNGRCISVLLYDPEQP